MALGRHGDGARYIHVASGKLHTTVAGEKQEYDFYQGQLVGIRCFEDEYEGQPVPKVELMMEDEDGKVRLKFGQETWYSWGFFARLPQIDVTQPFTVGAMPSEQNEKMTFCWMRQNGKKIPADKEGTPKPEKRKIGKKEVVDWTAFSEHAENVVLETAIRLGAPAAVSTGSAPPLDDSDYDADSDLPF